MKTYTIAPVPPITLVGMGPFYVATFGVLWLFIEPLEAFGLIPAISRLSGLYLYSLLLVIPALALLALLRWHRWHKTHDLPFVRLTVRSAADGATYSLRATENMQVAEFLHQYTEILLRGPARGNVEATLRRSIPSFKRTVMEVWLTLTAISPSTGPASKTEKSVRFAPKSTNTKTKSYSRGIKPNGVELGRAAGHHGPHSVKGRRATATAKHRPDVALLLIWLCSRFSTSGKCVPGARYSTRGPYGAAGGRRKARRVAGKDAGQFFASTGCAVEKPRSPPAHPKGRMPAGRAIGVASLLVTFLWPLREK